MCTYRRIYGHTNVEYSVLMPRLCASRSKCLHTPMHKEQCHYSITCLCGRLYNSMYAPRAFVYTFFSVLDRFQSDMSLGQLWCYTTQQFPTSCHFIQVTIVGRVSKSYLAVVVNITVEGLVNKMCWMSYEPVVNLTQFNRGILDQQLVTTVPFNLSNNTHITWACFRSNLI